MLTRMAPVVALAPLPAVPATAPYAWARAASIGAVLCALAPLLGAVLVVAAGLTVRGLCASHQCLPTTLADFEQWQTGTYAAISGRYDPVWWLSGPVLLLGVVTVAAAGWVAVALAFFGPGFPVARRWVVILLGLGIVAAFAALIGFAAELAWVNDYLE